MLKNDEIRKYLMMPVRMINGPTSVSVDVLLSTDKTQENWVPLHSCKKFKRDLYGYFLSTIELSAELCLGRNGEALEQLQEMFGFDVMKIIIKDRQLPFELRALYIRILLYMHMDREPLEPI